MALITFQDLPSTSTPINSANLNNNFNELANKGIENILPNTINSKTITTLSKSVNDFDFIIVVATGNAYGHRRIHNVLRNNLYSNLYQIVQLDTEHYEISIKIYDNKVDTSDCTYIGTDSYSIPVIYGVKL